ncbi:hypothetical protein VOLCADRAFT_116333 [Volvox carteri f. nagariensis]|uniref:Multiple myeloma tumor-associated protein 2-like N-terminal domain-containing protein n=1 Tax=Volvox carteri f. nagariensis TaxID=3068 RepID=D8TL72_VOLCA|nr:uncharacterized protein VOLCADRAFT_116333 [Volvox carteri f. nagariensis]EFJ51687.1 hypothetical protein VOLCADRAFT_116333 [Volvox carteri f. nagariensis]|eukprot:XP_002947097.1 hypothetical protein VOLCADRAFT_116333 [Volvox carteri f. nagariensis]
MSLYNGPPRPGRDVYWYTRDKSAQDAVQDEIKAVKKREEELMMEVLGLKPKTASKPAPQFDKHELNELIKGRQEEHEQLDKVDATAHEAQRMKGLGYVLGPGVPSEAVHTTLPGVGHTGPGPNAQQAPQMLASAGAAAPSTGLKSDANVALATHGTVDHLKALRRAEKRSRMEAKEDAKKVSRVYKELRFGFMSYGNRRDDLAKKEMKRSKKELKKARREGEGAKTQGRATAHGSSDTPTATAAAQAATDAMSAAGAAAVSPWGSGVGIQECRLNYTEALRQGTGKGLVHSMLRVATLGTVMAGVTAAMRVLASGLGRGLGKWPGL